MTIRDIHTHMRTRRLRRAAVAALVLGALSVAAMPSARLTFAAHPAKTGHINIGSKSFGEEYVVSRIYQLLLEKHGFTVGWHDLNETPQLQQAMLNKNIDLYPEYTGTGLQVVGVQSIVINQTKAYNTVKSKYENKYHFTWLAKAPMNDTNGVGVTQATSAKYSLHTLSDLAKVSNKLSFAGLTGCPPRPDCLAGMTSKYGIHFSKFVGLDSAPLRYKGLSSGQFDSVEVFTTDGPIQANHLVVLTDDKHAVFPADNLAPVIRDPVLKQYPQIASILNSVEPYLTTQAVIKLNVDVVLNSVDPLTAARKFLKSKHLI
jgi:osmoprotectant transport system substrate-binding protein